MKIEGMIRLRENFSANIQNSIPERVEKNTLQEKITEKGETSNRYLCGILKRVPISDFNENRNGRIYPKKLWEKVIKEGSGNGSYCLADHPEDDGSTTKLAGVWKNVRMEEDKVYADLCVLDNEFGRNIMALAEHSSANFSTSGFGEFLEDNKTVDPNSFILERAGDFVLYQSNYSAFATKENIGEESFDESFTNKYKMNENSEENNNMNWNYVVKNKIKEVKKMSSLTEATMELNSLLKEDIPAESKVLVESALCDIQEKIATKEQETENKLEKVIEQNEELNEALSEMKDKYIKALGIIESLKEEEEKSDDSKEKENDEEEEEITEEEEEKSGDSEDKEKSDEEEKKEESKRRRQRPLRKSVRERKVPVRKNILKENSFLTKNILNMEKDLDSYEESIKNMGLDMKTLEKFLKEAEDRIQILEYVLSENKIDISKINEKKIISKIREEESKDDSKEDSKEADSEKDVKDDESKEDEEKKEEKYRFSSSLKEEDSEEVEMDDEEVEDESDKMEEEEESDKSDDEEKVDEPNEGEEKKEENYKFSHKKMVESSSKVSLIEQYIKENPALKDIKAELKKCGSISEAIRMSNNFLNKKEDNSVKFDKKIISERSYLGNRF